MNLATLIDDHDVASVALVSRGKATTYGALREQVSALAGGFADAGVAPGDRIALLSANNWFFAVSYLAALSAGAVVVPLNPASPTAELQAELESARPVAAVVGPSGVDAFAGVDRARAGVDAVFVPAGVELAEGRSFEGLFAGRRLDAVARDDGDLAVLAFTSGTAGSPKAAMLTHGNLLANLGQLQHMPGRTLEAGDVALGVLPMFHIFGLNVILGFALYTGSSVVLVERFDPASSLQTIEERGVTLVAGAPPMFAAWAALPDTTGDELRSVRLAVSGAAPLDPAVADAFEARFGVAVRQGYGLTEASPVVTSSVVDGPPKPRSVGVPLPGVEVRLVDEEGDDALEGDSGEVWVRGPNVFSGYLDDPEATARALTDDGWLRTGDVAVVDDDGHLYLVDRAKDLIIVSGFNVFPAEVEGVLADHPGVADVAVIGVPHPHSGEAVKALVVVADGHSVEEDQLIEHCARRLARYKCPTKVTFVSSLPHGATGKVLRRELG